MNEYIDSDEHLSAEEVAAYLDGTSADLDRKRIEGHAADCQQCRRELTEVARILGRMRHAPAWRVWVPAAAAAAVIALLVLKPFSVETEPLPPHREAVPGAISLPQPIAPLGELEAVNTFAWSPVSGADRYRLTVFDDEGTVVWEAETGETRLAAPETVRFESGAQYFWKVVARVGFDRWVDSELVAFTISQP